MFAIWSLVAVLVGLALLIVVIALHVRDLMRSARVEYRPFEPQAVQPPLMSSLGTPTSGAALSLTFCQDGRTLMHRDVTPQDAPQSFGARYQGELKAFDELLFTVEWDGSRQAFVLQNLSDRMATLQVEGQTSYLNSQERILLKEPGILTFEGLEVEWQMK